MSSGLEQSTPASDDVAHERKRRASLTLPPEPASVPQARRFVAALDFTSCFDQDTLALLTAEIVTNAILHARTMLRLEAIELEDRIRVAVTDASATPPVKKSYGVDSPTGRGIRIVDMLAERWGFEVSGPGKTVWFELEPVKEPV